MLEQIGIFILFLGPLVFFHELGHFLFARFFGVRVEVFSIGFGPKLFKFKKGDTDYAISLIPLGGYVKMFGDDPLSEVELTPEEEKVAYTKKSKWARFWIVFGGPLANFIMAFFIYAGLLYFGERVPETRFGHVSEETRLYELGFRSGDVLKKLNELEVLSFDDLNLVDSNLTEVTINRNGKDKTLPIDMGGVDFIRAFSGDVGQLRAPVLIDGKGTNYLVKTESKTLEELFQARPQTIVLEPITSNIDQGRRTGKFETDSEKSINLELGSSSVEEFLFKRGFYPRDLWVNSIVMKSPAEKAGVKKGDIIIGVAGSNIYSFEHLRRVLQKLNKEEEVSAKVFRDTKVEEIKLTPQFREINGTKHLTIGVYSGIVVAPPKMIEAKEDSLVSALGKAVHRTLYNGVKILEGFKRLITGEVSIKNIGGPVAIGKYASDSFSISLSMFFRLMALISLNLGIINLFPIPVLDGGHIVFIICEAINRGPLSRKKLMMAQQFGVSLLFLLIGVALFNDITRFF